MSKIFAAIVAAMFAFGTTTVVAAQDAKKDAKTDEHKIGRAHV